MTETPLSSPASDLRARFLGGMAQAAATVNIVTTDGPRGRAGVTVSAMSSVSADMEKPVLLVCVHHLSPAAPAIHPAWRPMTSMTKTLVELSHIEATSRPASRIETATYLATEPKPGQLSVIGRSLSTVLGMPRQVTGKSC